MCVCVCLCELDLALNNLQWLIYYKTKPTNQPNNHLTLCKQMVYIELFIERSNTWNCLIVHKGIDNVENNYWCLIEILETI